MRSFDHVLHPGSVHGTAGLRTRLLLYFLLATTGLYAAGVILTLLPHGDRVTADISGGVVAICLGTAGAALLWLRPGTSVAHRWALAAAMVSTPAVMAFHHLAAAQSQCLLAAMFLAMYIRAFHSDVPGRALIAVLVVAVLSAVWVSPAPMYPISYLVFGVAIAAAGEAFGVVTKALIVASCTDPLTGVFNRAGWEMTTAEPSGGRTAGSPLVVVIVDVDDFKAVNDSAGHRAGDELLIDLTRAWSRVAPRGAVIARLGGDEFAALLTGHGRDSVDEFIRTTAWSLPYASVGTAESTDPEEPVSDVLARADAVLYEVKRARRESR
ncbi:Diguanylate cyclase (Ggdef) domain protein [Rhodococcus sp. AW25M09]|uniref:GGDEF domain-containing protein n=1 Tax=Rhodococcus sp. AW25M09 TaxID=1268303 RepID=UPI0002ACFEE7|nr:GGDEF domain-containing protein [Rhodococcus sp. AW25M09]CCQ13874.1 Diguanylate cyclase (Ggdef) domain protein [Rhodococcus sp. AW25M09]